MKIKTAQVLTSLDGKALKTEGSELTVGNAIASMLLAPRSEREIYHFDKVKSFVLAKKFYSDDEVDIDDADNKKLTDTIESDSTFGPVVSGQILLLLNETK